VVVNGNLLGGVRLYENDGDSSPFSGGTFTSLRSLVGALLFLGGFPMAYDGDPDNALDFFALGSGLSNLTFANRRNAGNFIDCGSVTSQNIESPELAGREAVVTQIKLTPTPAAPTVGTWSFQGSNDGETWHDAIPCNDDPTKYCVDFTTTSGSNIQWKLTMCSNDALSQAPTLEAVTTEFTYVAAANHFRAGPIARDGIIYVGAFREPGNDGRFMAIEDETQQVLWEASTKLDATAESARKIYAVGSDAAIHPLTTANASLFSHPAGGRRRSHRHRR
jgi:hypothetical protein